uniref:Radical SAM protein n=1 Tax=candidate division WOR-3 bacterium TaxID=2052148 RepID=A0A7V0Z3I5_UNCW3
MNPFIHKFQSFAGNHYIYDVRTNQFVNVNKVIYDIIDDFGTLQYDEIISKFKKCYEVESIKEALHELYRCQKMGLFSNKRFKNMTFPYDLHYLRKNLESCIGYMVVNLTEFCNMRCKYCSFSGTYIYERLHSNKRISDAVLYKAIRYYLSHSKQSRVKSISFYGGEPLTSFEKIMWVKSLIGKEVEIHIDSNGLLLGKEDIREAIIKNNFYLQISLDGPAVYHDRYRVDINGKPTFSRISSYLRKIQKDSPNFYRKNIHLR